MGELALERSRVVAAWAAVAIATAALVVSVFALRQAGSAQDFAVEAEQRRVELAEQEIRPAFDVRIRESAALSSSYRTEGRNAPMVGLWASSQDFSSEASEFWSMLFVHMGEASGGETVVIPINNVWKVEEGDGTTGLVRQWTLLDPTRLDDQISEVLPEDWERWWLGGWVEVRYVDKLDSYVNEFFEVVGDRATKTSDVEAANNCLDWHFGYNADVASPFGINDVSLNLYPFDDEWIEEADITLPFWLENQQRPNPCLR